MMSATRRVGVGERHRLGDRLARSGPGSFRPGRHRRRRRRRARPRAPTQAIADRERERDHGRRRLTDHPPAILGRGRIGVAGRVGRPDLEQVASARQVLDSASAICTAGTGWRRGCTRSSSPASVALNSNTALSRLVSRLGDLLIFVSRRRVRWCGRRRSVLDRDASRSRRPRGRWVGLVGAAQRRRRRRSRRCPARRRGRRSRRRRRRRARRRCPPRRRSCRRPRPAVQQVGAEPADEQVVAGPAGDLDRGRVARGEPSRCCGRRRRRSGLSCSHRSAVLSRRPACTGPRRSRRSRCGPRTAGSRSRAPRSPGSRDREPASSCWSRCR